MNTTLEALESGQIPMTLARYVTRIDGRTLHLRRTIPNGIARRILRECGWTLIVDKPAK